MKLLLALSALFFAHVLHVADPLGSPAYALTRAAMTAPCISIEDGVAEIMVDNSDKITRSDIGKLLIRANAQYMKLATGYPSEVHGFYLVAFTSPGGVTIFGSFPVNGKGCLLDAKGNPAKDFVWAMMDHMKARQILSQMPNKDI